MSDLYTNEDVINIIENEGLGYAITGYLSPSRIEDPELRELWKEAFEAMRAVERYLENNDL